MIILRSYLSPSLYINRLFVRTVLEVCLLALLIEGLYLSERSISVLKMIIDQPVGLTNFVSLLVRTSPEVQLALPLAVLIAMYRVILLYRENREFVALASGGLSTLPLIRFAAALAVAAMVTSLLVSGELAPRAKFAFRNTVESIRYQSLHAGSTPGQFVEFPNYTIYVWPYKKSETARPIFIKQIIDDKTYRIVNADRTEIIDRPEDGFLIIGMIGVTINDFPVVDERWIAHDEKANADARDLFCNGCGPLFKTLRSSGIVKKLEINSLVPSHPRGVTLDEWSTPELIGLTRPPAGREAQPGDTAEATRRLARGLLCFLAPFLGWLALTFTTRRSQAFALPVACVVLMCGDIGFSQAVTRFGAGNAGILASMFVVLTVGFVTLLVSQIVARQHLVIFPALARA